jgi:hypothetical protein
VKYLADTNILSRLIELQSPPILQKAAPLVFTGGLLILNS